jgi:hypothetical protein
VEGTAGAAQERCAVIDCYFGRIATRRAALHLNALRLRVFARISRGVRAHDSRRERGSPPRRGFGHEGAGEGAYLRCRSIRVIPSRAVAMPQHPQPSAVAVVASEPLLRPNSPSSTFCTVRLLPIISASVGRGSSGAVIQRGTSNVDTVGQITGKLFAISVAAHATLRIN